MFLRPPFYIHGRENEVAAVSRFVVLGVTPDMALENKAFA
jgi:hypothetical protein